MKKVFAWLLLGAVLLELCGCAAETASTGAASTGAAAASTENRLETVETEDRAQQATIQETEEFSQEPLFLKVSSITFSLVGDSEDIYLGLAPREQVTWESADPSVVSVENGVLTANGVGTTTIRAVYGNHQAECTAGCLAKTQEELESLDHEILEKPMRMVPEVDLETPCTFYDNALLAGDSITLMLFQLESKEDYLGNLLILGRNGTSLIGMVRRFKNLYYQGAEMNLEDIIAKSGVERIYILLGSNDIACPDNRVSYFDNWDIMLSRIQEKSPGTEVVVISNTPRCKDIMDDLAIGVEAYNAMVKEDNAKLEQYCKERGCPYLNLAYYIEDHCGDMAMQYNRDGYHMNDLGCMQWVKLMRYYAEYELAGGTIS